MAVGGDSQTQATETSGLAGVRGSQEEVNGNTNGVSKVRHTSQRAEAMVALIMSPHIKDARIEETPLE
jgi:hypothetical protein